MLRIETFSPIMTVCNVFDIVAKFSISMGVLSLIHNILAYGGKIIEY